MWCLTILGMVALLPAGLSAQEGEMDQKFVDMAINSNRFEIAIGGQATKKSSNIAIKQFAEMLVEDHTKVLNELEAMASAKNLSLPDQLEENHSSILKSLADLSGQDYDNAFKEIIIKAHEEAIALFELASKDDGVWDNELRSWAKENTPSLKSHLEKAKTLKTKKTGDMPPMPSIKRDSTGIL